MQFSVYDLNIREINLNQNNSYTNIINVKRPHISSVEGVLDVVYSMLINDDDPLSFVGPERELVMSMGGDEVQVGLGDNGTLRFSNLDSLNSVNPEDYLAIRLFANNDSANILWEYEFGINGLHVAYQIPDVETDVTNLLETTPNGRDLVRTLGGMRLKYIGISRLQGRRYSQLSGSFRRMDGYVIKLVMVEGQVVLI